VRWLDAIVMRVMDGLMSIPSVLLAIALMALTKASVGNVILAITLSEIPRVVRLVRGLVLSLREQPYVEAAVAAGTRLPVILVRHILPNTMAPLLVQGTYICASAMILEAVLSFIGAGTPPNIPSWGNIMAEARSLFQIAGYLILFPGILLSLTVLAVNLLGDGMRDSRAGCKPWTSPKDKPRAGRCSRSMTCRPTSFPATGSRARWTAFPFPSTPARRWRWWANRVAARASRRSPSCA